MNTKKSEINQMKRVDSINAHAAKRSSNSYIKQFGVPKKLCLNCSWRLHEVGAGRASVRLHMGMMFWVAG